MLAAGLDLLACPRCGARLELDQQVSCASGHTFDVARQGYLNLSERSAPRNADTADMVAARTAFLSAGHYDPIDDALIGSAPGTVQTVLDAGGGTGHYAARLLTAGAATRAVVLDVSVPAIRRAARAHPRLAAAVADVWRPLPVLTGVIDVVLSVFAPRNRDEFARVLNRNGTLVTVTPAPAHLAELRAELGLIEHHGEKAARLAQSLGGRFALDQRTLVEVSQSWTAATARASVLMGPNAFHLSADQLEERLGRLTWPRPVTVAVSVDRWRLGS